MLTIRQAAIQDASTINEITHKAFKLYADELNPGSHVKALEEEDSAVINDIENNCVLVGEDNGSIVGSIRIKKLSDELAYVYRFGVDPVIRNVGVGSNILQAALDYCKSCGYTAVTLHTNSKYYKLARYYYGKQFFVHSTTTDKGYIRALFVKELTSDSYDISPAFKE